MANISSEIELFTCHSNEIILQTPISWLDSQVLITIGCVTIEEILLNFVHFILSDPTKTPGYSDQIHLDINLLLQLQFQAQIIYRYNENPQVFAKHTSCLRESRCMFQQECEVGFKRLQFWVSYYYSLWWICERAHITVETFTIAERNNHKNSSNVKFETTKHKCNVLLWNCLI